MTQKEMIKDHLDREGSITSAEAMSLYGIARLASRIDEMRQDGYAIKSVPIISRNRYGKKIRYTRYEWEETNDTV